MKKVFNGDQSAMIFDFLVTFKNKKMKSLFLVFGMVFGMFFLNAQDTVLVSPGAIILVKAQECPPPPDTIIEVITTPMSFILSTLFVNETGTYHVLATFANGDTASVPLVVEVPDCPETNPSACNPVGITNNQGCANGQEDFCPNSSQFFLYAPFPAVQGASYVWSDNTTVYQKPWQLLAKTSSGTWQYWVVVTLPGGEPQQYCFSYTVNCNGITGTEEQVGVEKNEISVYPNPASDFIQVGFGETQESEFQIFDVAGKEIISGTIQSSEEIETSNLPAGVYFIRLIIDGKICTQQFVKE